MSFLHILTKYDIKLKRFIKKKKKKKKIKLLQEKNAIQL